MRHGHPKRPCRSTRCEGNSAELPRPWAAGAAWAARAALLATCLAAAPALALDDFPTWPDEGGLRPEPIRPAGPELRGALGWRAHYAYRTPPAAYAFTRRRPGWTSHRMSLRLEARTPLGSRAQAVAGVRLSHEAARLDAPSAAEARADEVFIDLQPVDRWRLKLGQQLLPLGASDYFQLQDVMSPRDLRILGATDLRDARLPVWATRVSHERERSAIELIVRHRFQADRHGAPGSDFDPAIALGGLDRAVLAAAPRLWRHPDAAVRWQASQPWGDVQALWARVVGPGLVLAGVQGERPLLGHQHSSLWGAGGNLVTGDWVFKGEYARRANARPARRGSLASGETGPVPLPSATRPMSQWMLGTRYTGIKGLSLDAELLTQRMHRHQADFTDPRTTHAAVLNATWTGWRDRLRIELLVARWSGGSAMLRAQAAYELDDAWLVRLGLIDYHGGHAGAPLAPYRNNDRVLLGLERAL
jgi:hypothetical protein